MDTKPVEPTRGKLSDGVKLLISALYLITPLGLMVYRFWNGESVDSIILLLVVIMIIASAYVVFGEKHIDKATETAKELTGDSSDDEKE